MIKSLFSPSGQISLEQRNFDFGRYVQNLLEASRNVQELNIDSKGVLLTKTAGECMKMSMLGTIIKKDTLKLNTGENYMYTGISAIRFSSGKIASL